MGEEMGMKGLMFLGGRIKIRWWGRMFRCWGLMRGSMLTSKAALMGELVGVWLTVASLQYQNRKAEYFSAIWDVINWKTVEKRFEA